MQLFGSDHYYYKAVHFRNISWQVAVGQEEAIYKMYIALPEILDKIEACFTFLSYAIVLGARIIFSSVVKFMYQLQKAKGTELDDCLSSTPPLYLARNILARMTTITLSNSLSTSRSNQVNVVAMQYWHSAFVYHLFACAAAISRNEDPRSQLTSD